MTLPNFEMGQGKSRSCLRISWDIQKKKCFTLSRISCLLHLTLLLNCYWLFSGSPWFVPKEPALNLPLPIVKYASKDTLTTTDLRGFSHCELWFQGTAGFFTFGARWLQIISGQRTPAHRKDVPGVKAAPVVKCPSPPIKSDKDL